MARNEKTVQIDDARIFFRNFAGKEGKYNREGDRNFAVAIPDELAEAMYPDGWNIKVLNAREEGDADQAYLSVAVGYKGRPPRIVIITSRGRTDLGEDEVEMLDWVDIVKVDLIIRPYNWEVSGNTGVKAYLKTLVVTIDEDALELKYADVPETKNKPAVRDHQEPAFEVSE